MHNTELNDTLVHVFGQRDDGRVVGETTGSRAIAVPPACVRILDFKEDVEQIQQKGRSILLCAHPDKCGCRHTFELLLIIVRATSN